MPSVFVVSDTHFGHRNICKFLRSNGEKVRPWDDVEQMDEDMVRLWNEKVGPNDKVYHLGDVVINRSQMKTLGRLNGDKILIKGNHDIFKRSDYLTYFRDIRAYHVMTGVGLIFSHIPIHPDSLGRFGTNVHGHLHTERVRYSGPFAGEPPIDPRYYCVSVEHIDFAPILLEDLIERIKEQGGTIGMKSERDACAAS